MQLRFMLEEQVAEAMWSAKDRLRREMLIEQNPLEMHRTKFDAWTKAVAAKMLEEADANNVDEEDAVEVIVKHLTKIHKAWHEEAKRRRNAS